MEQLPTIQDVQSKADAWNAAKGFPLGEVKVLPFLLCYVEWVSIPQSISQSLSIKLETHLLSKAEEEAAEELEEHLTEVYRQQGYSNASVEITQSNES